MASHQKKNSDAMSVTCSIGCMVFIKYMITIFLTAVFTASASSTCDRQRKILTDSYGIISSGDKEYAMDSHCEWLIKASNIRQSISFTFNRMDTECSYDHIFVYDGDSYASPLLGSFSGNSTPVTVMAKSGAMLVLLYSDTNYVRTGFEAFYTVSDCPLNCSEKGLCIDHRCVCDFYQTGEACDINLCPHECWKMEGKGECFGNTSKARCKCRDGYSGVDCSLSDSNKGSGNTWHVISPDKLYVEERAGHSGIYVESSDVFYIFGGYSFKKVYGDLLAFNFSLNKWLNLTQSDGPSPRKSHAATILGNDFVIFGGELENGSLSDELWLFNTSISQWQLLSSEEPFWPPPITKHSITFVETSWLYVFGGSLADHSFSHDIYRATLDNGVSWEKVAPHGGKQNNKRLIGHTAVYYPPAKSLFIYGGVTAEFSHVSKLSFHIYAFHTQKLYWTQINAVKDRNAPLERAFHTAAVVGDYMVVYGGYTHRHAEEEICYDNKTYLYHLRCHKWIDFKSLTEDFPLSQEIVGNGVFSHVMGVRHGHTLLIHGGYSGVMHSIFKAYVLPPSVVGRSHLSHHCENHTKSRSCTANLACIWCSEKNVCMERKNQKACGDSTSESCPGLCPSLSTCHSCLIWGDSSRINAISDDSLQDNFPTASCVWFVQAMLCLPVHEADHFRAGHTKATRKQSSSLPLPVASAARWWGPNQTVIATLNECYTKDFPPGLISIKYKHPVNWSQPDEVSLLRLASEELYFRSDMTKNESTEVEENVVRFIAYLHPLSAKPLAERLTRLQLYMCSSGFSAVLKLSNDSTLKNLEVVANHTTKSSFFCSEVLRLSGTPNFPNVSQGHKYLFDFTVFLSTDNESATMQLAWNAFSLQPEVISDQYLEPYKNGSCAEHKNCLACMTDNACGWCRVIAECYNKLTATETTCRRDNDNYFLISHPNECAVCSDYMYCEHCTQVPSCEWLVETAFCVRRGRYPVAVRSIDKCPTACHLRNSCSSCLKDPGVCAWCEATQTCFLFSTYTTSYIYGRCRDWVDENRSEPNTDPVSLCRDCSKHKDCKQCLRDLSCGWCSDNNNPFLGMCKQGDFRKPSDGTCYAALQAIHNSSLLASSVQWSYDICPDVEECALGLHDCHENATCKNTHESFICECNIGFKGDGHDCIRACVMQCINGHCSGAPEYKCICQLGWTGEDCSIDCNCNNHSTCTKGPRICDMCEDWTEGKFCENCKPGSYGSAVTAIGCHKCECNGHGRSDKSYCDTVTGVCFCKDNTEGTNCSKCEDGYFGDPRNGGHCFEECKPRGVITEVTNGRLGSSAKIGRVSDCLWLLTIYPAIDVQSLIGPMLSTDSAIQLVIHDDMRIPCPHNHLYIYDGLPNFVASGHPNVLLGSFCGTNLSQEIVLTAASGYLAIHFKHNGMEEHFTASYSRLENYFDSNHTCFLQSCKNYSTNVSSDADMCPNNCSAAWNHGVCDIAYGKCICENGHGGVDCSVTLKSSNLVWTSIYNYEKTVEKTIDTPSGRMGHSLLAVNNESTDFENLWLFGGYSTSAGDMNDVFMFEAFRRQWMKVETEKPPPARHLHASATYGSSIYVYGGMNSTHVLDDFWKFNTITYTWSQLQAADAFPRAGSTLTAVRGGELYLIGGMSAEYGFFEKVAVFNVKNEEWHLVNCSGAQPIGIYGHSSIYHADTKSIYVFGGLEFEVDSISVSSNFYAFQYSIKRWYRLPPDNQVNPVVTRPQPRYFHSAVVAKNYMIIIGGRSSFSGTDINPSPYAYVFSCNFWISLTEEDIDVVGKPPDVFIAGAAAITNGDAYLFGGSDGELKKLSSPVDFCQTFSSSRVRCIFHTGCAFCSVFENGVNQTFCYSQVLSIPPSCYNPKDASEVVPAVTCNTEWIEKRDCGQYSSCTDCVTAWPAFSNAKQVCQWCSYCKIGRCVPSQTSCENENDCNISHKVINSTSSCPMRTCWASDCEKCLALGDCIWTRQVQRTSGFGHMLNRKPIYSWICVMKEVQDAPPFPIKSMPPLECPPPCMKHTNCSSCLQSSGGEGGWHQCMWSENIHTCMSPSFELLRCEDGSCGPILQHNASHCPVPCWYYEQASHCLAHVNCGWCAFSGSSVDGRGLCMEGGIVGPTGGLCHANQVTLLGTRVPIQIDHLFAISSGPPTWNYLTKPPENECANGHHTCDERHQVCVDTKDNFVCVCKPGYELKSDDESECKPICRQGCVNGTCVRPDDCKCNFGYVGRNCSIACKCNGHSHCPGPDALDICPDCQNNTQGPRCQKCKPLFVGNPVNGGKCTPCHVYCHGHSSICLNSDLLMNNGTAFSRSFNQTYMTDLIEKMTEGAWNDVVCLDCQNNTEGKKCEQCVSGYFKAGETFEDGCRPCECHGHGDTCNPFNGEGCNCQNNTENDRQCNQKNSKNIITPCWLLQCSKCKEYFLGAPVHGHQCYRHMFLDKDYCFDPNTHEECSRKPGPLLAGRTVNFAVQPRYMNVDIRIVVDVTEGAIDFLLSPKEDTFIVEVNKTNGVHHVSIDKKYGNELSSDFELMYYGSPSANKISKRDTAVEDAFHDFPNVTESLVTSSLFMREASAKDLTTYVTMRKSHEFLVVRNLKNRLIITIPQEVHDLRSTRFYMILRGVSIKQVFLTYGNLFFRQDQTRIDLFVFFSVFFSCFFLFLAGCVVVWKVKQAFDVRRARRLHAAEMKHMASRPFSRVVTIIEEDLDDYDFPFYSPTNCRKKTKHKVYGRDSPKITEERFCLRPIAVEPLANGAAAVATILVQLPGNARSLVKMTLASSMITARSSHYHVGCGIRAAMRRRTSHINA